MTGSVTISCSGCAGCETWDACAEVDEKEEKDDERVGGREEGRRCIAVDLRFFGDFVGKYWQ